MHAFEVATRVRGAAVVCAPNVVVDASCTSSAGSIQLAIDAAAGDTVPIGGIV